MSPAMMAAVLFLALSCLMSVGSGKEFHFRMDLSKSVGDFKHFWKSTGFCPPLPHEKDAKYFLSDDEFQNLAFIGSVPRRGIEQVRVHWLLDSVTVKEVSNGIPIYDFKNLDIFISILWRNELKPGFEIMGNPSNIFNDFENDTQVQMWKVLVQFVAERYIRIYGLNYVSSWAFETWNEPDHGDFDHLNMTIQGFLNYYDACSEGLKAASPKLILGGPAGSCHMQETRSKKCWALLEHCESGTNYFTKEKGVRIDYISFHHKGGGSSLVILNSTLETIQQIHQTHPKLANVPIYNDEADPLVGWSHGEWWRADATYAAVVAKVIGQHQNQLIRSKPDYHYVLLSNDNGFLNYNPYFFEQRTLNARFQMNHTNPPSVQFVKKPVIAVMGLLALLGDRQVDVTAMKRDKIGWTRLEASSDIGVLAATEQAAGSWQAGILIYNSADTSPSTSTDSVELRVDGIPTGGVMYVVYHINNEESNPHAIWEKNGKPPFPSQKLFSEMRAKEEPLRAKGPSVFSNTSATFDLTIPKPGVVLYHFCQHTPSPPGKVYNFTYHRVSVDVGLFRWSDVNVKSPCILTYELEFSDKSASGPYKRVNQWDIIFTSFVFSPDMFTSLKGWYRVSAVDYWNRRGVCSDILFVEHS